MIRASAVMFFITLVYYSSFAAYEKPLVVSSASMFSDMASVIAGNLADIETIVPIGGDPHLHDPTPRDAKIVAAADLILVNGLSFEGWISELIENAGTQGTIVTISDGVQAIESDQFKGSTDPHAWMDASNGRIYIQNIRDALIKLLPQQESEINSRYLAYDTQLKELDEYIKRKINDIPESVRYLITSHDAFAYYGRRYNINLEPIVGISTEAEAQTSDIMRVSNVIRTHQIPAVFIESTINPKLLEQIANDFNIVIGGELYADSLGDELSPAATYLSMLRHNTDSISAGLTGKQAMASKTKESDNAIYVYLMLGVLLLGGFIFMARKM